MTFLTGVWAVNGNSIDATLMRLMNQAATLGSNGVIGHLDCQVQANSPATAGIIITPGGVVALGQETSYQGSYTSWNVGNDTTLSIAPTTGTPRSDLVVVRAEDPTWPSSPWGGSPAGQILFPRVISNVAGGTTQAPAGISAVALARIDMPATSSVVQASYIHDVRQVANPQRVTLLNTGSGVNPGTNSTASSTTAAAWPAGASWSIQIPATATQMITMWSVNEVVWNGDGNGTVRIFVWPILGTNVNSPVLNATPQALSSVPSAQGPWRHTISGGGTVAIPASLRGTTQTLQFAEIATGTTNTATFSYQEGSSVTILTQFVQNAAAA